MVLKFSLKSGEHILVNGAEISVDADTGELAIHNHARILRENEFLGVDQLRNALAAPETFNAPETWLYYLLQMIYLQPEHSELNLSKLPDAFHDLRESAPDQVELLVKISELIDEGEVFLAMRELREVFPNCVETKSG